MAQAVPYEMVSKTDFSRAGRERWKIVIYAPTAATREQRAHTALRAALDHAIYHDGGHAISTRPRVVVLRFKAEMK